MNTKSVQKRTDIVYVRLMVASLTLDKSYHIVYTIAVLLSGSYVRRRRHHCRHTTTIRRNKKKNRNTRKNGYSYNIKNTKLAIKAVNARSCFSHWTGVCVCVACERRTFYISGIMCCIVCTVIY